MAFWEYCFSECPLFKQGAFWKTVLPECHGFRTGRHSAQNAMVSEQGAFYPECHGFRTGGHSAQNAMVSEQGAFWKTVLPECHGFRFISPSLSLLTKNTFHLGKSGTNQLIMLKFHLFPRDSWKDAGLGPPKLPSGLRPSGSFGRPRPASYQESLGKRRNFGPQWVLGCFPFIS